MREGGAIIGPDPLVFVNREVVILSASPAAQALIDARPGIAFPSLFHDHDADALYRVASTGWLGAADRAWTALAGQRIHLTGVQTPEGSVIAVRDLSLFHAVERCERQKLRREALAEVAGALARELNDPMSIVQGRLELLLELGDRAPDASAGAAEALERHLNVAVEHARRVGASLRNLRLVGQAPRSQLGTIDVAEFVAAAVDIVAPRRRRFQVSAVITPELACSGESGALARVTATLIEVLVDIGGRDRTIEVHAAPDAAGVCLAISLPGADRRDPCPIHAFPGPAVKMADTLVQAVGGVLTARRGPGGTTFEIALIAAQERPNRARPHEDRLLIVGGPQFVATVSGLLDLDGFDIYNTPDGERALLRLQADDAVSAVVIDLVLPGMSGMTLAEEATRRHPGLGGRTAVVCEVDPGPFSPAITLVRPPLARSTVLTALGRRVRRRVAPTPRER